MQIHYINTIEAINMNQSNKSKLIIQRNYNPKTGKIAEKESCVQKLKNIK